ncbi:DUF3168 domain-containing protein [Brevundimonas sp.]|uniref:DUF3168 domain-containing protein n=1 Tax=Brevundimonas sp. TaxID=1871086 RepID=UPI002D58B0E4|nr:DUF3168 domain-containing protein [Brevundimonas sp.]HYC66644.1 DUF3168 domain-containing protein [Brevundimonas sp.]
MIDPSLAIQAAIVAALRAPASVKALIGNPARVYDSVPTGAAFPYVSLGASQVLNDGNGCGEQAEVYLSLDCWSRAVGFPEVRQIAAAVSTALSSPLTVTGYVVVIQDVEDINYRRDADGLTSRATVALRLSLVASA